MNQSDAVLLPTVSLVTADPDQDSADADYLLSSYRRTDLAMSDPSTVITAQWADGLARVWMDVTGAPGVVIEELNDAADEGVDLVKVYIPRDLGGKLFVRLGVAINMD